MRTRESASENDSGREKADLSTSSAHGRRWEKARRAESERRVTKARSAGVATTGTCDCVLLLLVVVWGFEIGRIGGWD